MLHPRLLYAAPKHMIKMFLAGIGPLMVQLDAVGNSACSRYEPRKCLTFTATGVKRGEW